MPYTPTIWKNLPSIQTPLNANNLNKMEEGIKDAQASAESALAYQAPTVNLGNKSGSVSLSSYFGYIVSITLTGSVTIPSSGRPTVPTGISGATVLRLQQDATGSRTFMVEGARTRGGMPTLIAAGPNEVSLLSLVRAGSDWWLIENVSGGAVPSGW